MEIWHLCLFHVVMWGRLQPPHRSAQIRCFSVSLQGFVQLFFELVLVNHQISCAVIRGNAPFDKKIWDTSSQEASGRSELTEIGGAAARHRPCAGLWPARRRHAALNSSRKWGFNWERGIDFMEQRLVEFYRWSRKHCAYITVLHASRRLIGRVFKQEKRLKEWGLNVWFCKWSLVDVCASDTEPLPEAFQVGSGRDCLTWKWKERTTSCWSSAVFAP